MRNLNEVNDLYHSDKDRNATLLMHKNNEMKTTEKIIDGLKKAAAELEKLQLQAALGRAEARDRYEQARKEFQMKLEEVKLIAKGKFEELKPMLESFEVQFALGKMEAKEKFEENAKKFSQAIREVESFLKEL
jgi:hypothetical protein